jgi:putative transport protein
VQVSQEQSLSLLLAGALVTTLSVTVGVILSVRAFKMETLEGMGALSAAMTNPPGLSAANRQTVTDQATLAYASVYPATLIFKFLFAQILMLV